MILVDTSVWIDFFRGIESPERYRLRDLIESGDEISIAGIILTEILQGTRNDDEFETLRRYFANVAVHNPGSAKTYIDAAQLYRTCRKKGITIRSTIDCIIASICIENDLILLHKDIDFENIALCSDLKILAV